MLVPVKWLSEYVDISDIKINKLENDLIMSGSNIETGEETLKNVKNIVVGKIVSIKQHPDADRLKVLKVDVGYEDGNLQIVTGATNVVENAYLPVCLVGAVLSDKTKIKKGALRGVDSYGMLCSFEELGYNKSVIPKPFVEGVWLLDKEYPLGTPIGEIEDLKDYVIEFEITPNRPDCLSIIGMAHEAAATFNKEVKLPESKAKNTHADINDFIDIEIESDLCSRYMGAVVTDVNIEPAPLWMQNRLMNAGIRPVSNIVDITNYVLLEYGQPSHAFDLDKVSNKKIIIRNAKKDETLITLDDEERALKEEYLVIADDEKTLALAGVMGGKDSEISDDTKNILIEVAKFDKKSVRKTSKELSLRTESSSRFEKGISQHLQEVAMDRICYLIEALNVGKVVKGYKDVIKTKEEIKPVEVRVKRINDLLGLTLSSEEIEDILTRLEITVEGNDVLTCTPPYYRLDLLQEIDFVEEVARIYGYNNIKSTLFKGNSFGMLSDDQKLRKHIRETLVASGVNEITTYSFVSPSTFDKILVPEDDDMRKTINIMNPLGEEYSVMRRTLLPNLLDVMERNYKKSIEEVLFFELGNVFIPTEDKLPTEEKNLVIGGYGKEMDFFTLKGIAEHLLDTLHMDYEFERAENPSYHPGISAVIYSSGKRVGVLGKLHPKLLENYNLPDSYALEFDYKRLLSLKKDVVKFESIPKYPSSSRDLAILVKDDITNNDVLKIIKKKGGKLLESVELFDVYKGNQIEENYKSMAYKLVFRSKEGTLVDDDVNERIDKILKKLESDLDAKLR